MAVAAALLLASVVELGEVAVLDETDREGDVAPGDEEVGFSWNSFLMVMDPVRPPPPPPSLDVDAGEVVEDEALPMGGNTIRIPEPELPAPAAAFFGCRPTAFATALMIAALVKLFPEDPVLGGTGVVDPFVLLLLLVFIVQGAASEPGCVWAYSVLWMILTCAVMLSFRVNSLKQYGHG